MMYNLHAKVTRNKYYHKEIQSCRTSIYSAGIHARHYKSIKFNATATLKINRQVHIDDFQISTHFISQQFTLIYTSIQTMYNNLNHNSKPELVVFPGFDLAI